MAVKTVSNEVPVRDAQKVRDILDRYEILQATLGVRKRRGKEVWKRGGKGILSVAFDDETDGFPEFPCAFPRDQWSRDALDSVLEGDDDKQVSQLVAEGEEGFEALLLELAPHLEEPLMIIGISTDPEICFAQSWTVQPGATEVQTLFVAL